MLDAQFIGAIQVLVYAGAIMVVFLFVIMLLNLGQPASVADTRGLGWKLAAGAVGIALLARDLRAHAGADARAAHAAAGLRRASRSRQRRDRADRRAAVQRVSARVRGDERAAARGRSSARSCSASSAEATDAR